MIDGVYVVHTTLKTKNINYTVGVFSTRQRARDAVEIEKAKVAKQKLSPRMYITQYITVDSLRENLF